MNWPQAIKTAREHAGLSQEYIGKVVGFDASMVHHWERGNATPTVNELEVIAERCGLTFMSLAMLAADDNDLEGIKSVLRLPPAEALEAFGREMRLKKIDRTGL